ncbi:uncharacterized protein BO80DRAFT_464650 [Aspergillus ibericus CBS 121593]|uniref:F-box domain-containing protein n=1 Tax=Aspergillus ibericus CBS 121593 TaxID=1448316 RepID=A0A395H182_9EURO|nr:hypothetical protein BO80DRAFT_464650 [Aspergillus ibericus CBS 121593]RAL01403.1 hypothetical protein BO80DRAFT_464650 [Aspergillus ibericus CBS 121593]
MHTTSTTNWVLSTPELLELILLHLDLRTLLTCAPLVCHFWNTLIQQSTPLQETLYFKPIKPKHHPSNANASIARTLNPLLVDSFPAIFHQNGTVFPQNKEPFSLTDLDMVRRPEKRDSYLRPEASWRRMLIQQPPATKLGVFSWSGGMFGYGFVYEVQELTPTERYDGIRMEMLFNPLIFHRNLAPTFNPASIYWWGECSSPLIRRHLSEVGVTTLPDVILCMCAMVSCTDPESDFENEEVEVVEGVRGWFRGRGMDGGLEGLGKQGGGGWEKSIYEKRGSWD